MKFSPTIIDDIPQIEKWIELDPDHQNRMSADWWLTGNDCLLAFCVEDEIGPVMYVRLDAEGNLARLHTQFGPPSDISKERVVNVLTSGFPVMAKEIASQGYKGIIFESVSRRLIRFMSKLNFTHHDKHDNGSDYVLNFAEVESCVDQVIQRKN